eukprot:13621265-Alexandrium_andersonii.AAC.1
MGHSALARRLWAQLRASQKPPRGRAFAPAATPVGRRPGAGRNEPPLIVSTLPHGTSRPRWCGLRTA